MQISRSFYGKKQEFELTREELKQAYQEYDELVIQEQIERFLLERKGVHSLDSYSDVISDSVKAYKQYRTEGKPAAEALLDAISENFRYMEQTPDGLVVLMPGFVSMENFQDHPVRVCFCLPGIELSKANPGYTGTDFLRLTNGDRFAAKVLLQLCSSMSMTPESVMSDPAFSEKVMALGSKLAAEHNAAEQEREAHRQRERERAMDIYKSFSAMYGGEGGLFDLAIDVYYLQQAMLDTGKELSPEDACRLAQRLQAGEGRISKDLRFNALRFLLLSGTENNQMLPPLTAEQTCAMLLTCSTPAFIGALDTTVIWQHTQLRRAFHLVADPGRTAFIREVESTDLSGHVSLDGQVTEAKSRTNGNNA